MDQGQQSSGGAEDGGRAEPVENLIKPREQSSTSPLVGRRDARNVKRPAGDEEVRGGGKSVYLGLAVIGLAVVVLGVLGAGRISELEARLSESGGGASGQGGDQGGISEAEIGVLREQVLTLEKEVARLRDGSEAEGQGASGEDDVLGVLKKRAELAALADEAIAMGFRSVVRKIDASVDGVTDEEILRAANAEKARVEIYYLNGAGFFPVPLPEEQDGVPMAEIGTDRLAEYLLVAESPGPLRARAAQLLGRRMEVLSADALSESLMLEPDLRVLVHATASFRRVTGCPIPSVFGGPEMREWLTGNRELVEERFKDIAERQAAARAK